MEAAYIFCENDRARVPLFDYDKRLFSFFISHGGKWDKERQEFVLEGYTETEKFKKGIPGVPFVWVNNKSPVPVKVYGFLERPWNGKETINTVTEQPQIKIAAPAPVNTQELPDKFPLHWESKLDTEFGSTKYAHKTRVNYLYYIRLLCKIRQKTPEEIQSDDIKKFMAYLDNNKRYSAASMNLALSAIKFFYSRILPKDIINEQRRPRQDKKAPVILSKKEIKEILAVVKNLKHRILITLAYASGLRVGEAVKLEKENIDIERKAILIKSGKGRKDRYTVLPENIIKDLTDYYFKYDIAGWIFPSKHTGDHISIRTAQHVFKQACKKAKIEKTATTHSLRHSFATHLVESGTNILYIKDLLGHLSVRTTERYTHVSRKNVLAVQSPFDRMDEEE